MAFEEMIKDGVDLYTVDTSEYLCMEIDTADDLQKAGEVINQYTNLQS